jgi:hypothetical protein
LSCADNNEGGKGEIMDEKNETMKALLNSPMIRDVLVTLESAAPGSATISNIPVADLEQIINGIPSDVRGTASSAEVGMQNLPSPPSNRVRQH